MTLSEMRSLIVENLYSFSAYDLPGICESLGLKPGTGHEAFQSKRRYVSERIQGLNKSEILVLLRKLRDQFSISLVPEDNYTYKITNITKKAIKDLFVSGFAVEDFYETRTVSVSWHGDLSEIEFIKRITDISKIQVENKAFKTFEEEYKFHREIANDYSQFYFFESDRLPFKNSNSEEFLKIICEIIHPEVRCEDGYWKELMVRMNSLINADGYELYVSNTISGRSVFSARKITFATDDFGLTQGLERMADIINTDYIRHQMHLLIESLNIDSPTAIGKSKELLETAFKYILNDIGITLTGSEDMSQLHKMVTKELGLTINEKNERIDGASQVLNGLISINVGMSSLRNKYGDGHGKAKSFTGLPPRYGKLAVGTVSAYITFLFDTYEERKSLGKIDRS